MNKGEGSCRYLCIFTLILVLLISITACGCVREETEYASSVDETQEWRRIPLQDISTREIFTMESLNGSTILLFTFTTSCPVCIQQQKEIMSLATISSYPIIPVGLDIEPNADKEKLATYLQRNDFSGHYALSPPDMTRSLVNSFGMEIISPATAPVVLICPQGEAQKLRAGLKPATEVLEALQQEC